MATFTPISPSPENNRKKQIFDHGFKKEGQPQDNYPRLQNRPENVQSIEGGSQAKRYFRFSASQRQIEQMRKITISVTDKAYSKLLVEADKKNTSVSVIAGAKVVTYPKNRL